jgi:hypothetical protein
VDLQIDYLLMPEAERQTTLSVEALRLGKGDDAADETELLTSNQLLLLWDVPVGRQQLSLPYHDPLPSEWPRVVRVQRSEWLDVTVPGRNTFVIASPRWRVTVPLAEAESGPLAPLVGPPRDVKLGVDREHGGLRVDWSAPEVGRADGYIVTVLSVDLRPEGTGWDVHEVARYYTVETSLATVPEPLDPMELAYVIVTALTGEDIDLLHAPHRRGLRYGLADAVSEVIEVEAK